MLDITSLKNARQRPVEGLARYRTDTGDTQIRDGLIQRFKFTYEISHKTLTRYLAEMSPSPEIFDAMPFAEIIRVANEQDLLRGNWADWKRYRAMRGKTSHAYSEEAALEVVGGIPDFLAEVHHLIERLEARLSP